jgi:hypothetical protein
VHTQQQQQQQQQQQNLCPLLVTATSFLSSTRHPTDVRERRRRRRRRPASMQSCYQRKEGGRGPHLRRREVDRCVRRARFRCANLLSESNTMILRRSETRAEQPALSSASSAALEARHVDVTVIPEAFAAVVPTRRCGYGRCWSLRHLPWMPERNRSNLNFFSADVPSPLSHCFGCLVGVLLLRRRRRRLGLDGACRVEPVRRRDAAASGLPPRELGKADAKG